MPFFKKIENKNGVIGIWKLSESSAELLSKSELSTTDSDSYKKIKAEQRQAEFLATRLLLQQIRGKKIEIGYSSAGKPFIPGSSLKLSISHSADFVCVFVSDKNIGIDVEQSSRPIDRVANRFLHPDEYKHISTLKDQQFAKVLYWSAKEAVFKSSETQGISFKDQIRIEAFNPEMGRNFVARLIFPDKTIHCQLSFESFENNVMVYSVQQ